MFKGSPILTATTKLGELKGGVSECGDPCATSSDCQSDVDLEVPGLPGGP